MKKYIFIPLFMFLVSGTITTAYLMGTKQGKEKVKEKYEKEVVAVAQATPHPQVIAATDFSEESVNTLVKNTLPGILLTPTTGKVFCNSHYYSHKIEDNRLDTYVWAFCEEYIKEGENVKSIQGVSTPLKVSFNISEGNPTYTSFIKPKDGGSYTASIAEIFPEEVVSEVLMGFDTTLFYPTPLQQAKVFYLKSIQ